MSIELIKTVAFLLLGVCFFLDFRRDKGQHLGAKLIHFTILTLLIYGCSESIPYLPEIISGRDWSTHWVAAGPFSPALHFSFFVILHAISALTILVAILMSLRSQQARQMFLFLAPALLIIGLLNLYCDSLKDNYLDIIFMLFTGALGAGLAILLIFIYMSPMMDRFFNPLPSGDINDTVALLNNEPMTHPQSLKPDQPNDSEGL